MPTKSTPAQPPLDAHEVMLACLQLLEEVRATTAAETPTESSQGRPTLTLIQGGRDG
jgi:hypothetical protein